MTFVPFPEWLPDMPDFMNPGSPVVTNVVPLTAQGYGPFASPVAPLPATVLLSQCLGMYSFLDNGGVVQNFAGDASRLYLLNLAGLSLYADVSETTGGPYSAAGTDGYGFWSMTAFGDRMIFTDYVDPIQTYLVGTDTKFSELSAAAPKARYAAVIRDFLMVGNTNDPTSLVQPRRVWWPAIGDPTNWPTPGTNTAIELQSDYQDLEATDLGEVKGIVGDGLAGADGAVFCDRGIYRVIYIGSPAIFDFAVAQGSRGTLAPRSIVHDRGLAYYLAPDGFYVFDGGSPAVPIGAQKVDKFFFDDAATLYIKTVLGAADPEHRLIFWAYASNNSPTGLYDRLLVYNWQVNRFTFVDLTATPAEWISRSLLLGYTLDQLDVFGVIDTLPYSLDSGYWLGGRPVLALINMDHALAYLVGPNLPAVIETSEMQPLKDRRARVKMARAIGAGAGAAGTIAVGSREFVEDDVSPTWGPEIPINAFGWSPQMKEGRYLRGRLTLPAGAVFKQLQGIDVQIGPAGRLL